jgi:hypothetical protein
MEERCSTMSCEEVAVFIMVSECGHIMTGCDLSVVNLYVVASDLT